MKMTIFTVLFLLPAVMAYGESPSEYVNRFQQALQKHVGAQLPDHFIKRIEFRIKPLWHNDDDARCVQTLGNRSSEKIIIELDDWMWRRANDLYKELVVFHELGHCVLSRAHEDGKENGIPKSMMTLSGLDWRTYLIYREYYHTELFKRLNSH